MAEPDESTAARVRAEEMEANIELTRQDSVDTISLLAKLDKLAASYFEHAKNWEDVNPEIASRIRKQATEIHELHHKVEMMAEWEADEIDVMMSEVNRVLKQAREARGHTEE